MTSFFNLVCINKETEGGAIMIRKFTRSSEGNVVGYILVIAMALAIGYKFFLHLQLRAASSVEDHTVATVDSVSGSSSQESVSQSVSRSYVMDESKQIHGVLTSPIIKISPESDEYFYSYNDQVSIEAIPASGDGYVAKKPISCKWSGINYSGTSCQIESAVKLKVGDNHIEVTLCDSRRACAKQEKNIYLGYRDPLLVIHDEWDNYVLKGDSGEWKYDDKEKIIYSTKNVDWSGYWNPKDAELTDYEINFNMRVYKDGDDDSIGFTFRMKDTKNFYFFTLDNRDLNGGTTYHSGLYKSVNGTKTRLVNLLPIKWERNNWNAVKIKVKGNHIQVWLDGSLVADVTDASNPKGGYGPFSYSQAYAQYKDLKVTIQ